MEHARIASPQGTQSVHAARGKPAAQGKDSLADAQGGAAPGGFMALLAALGEGNAPEALASQVAADDALIVEPKDVAAQGASQGGLLPWAWAAVLTGGAAQEVPEVPGQGITAQGMAGQGIAGQGISAQAMAGQGTGTSQLPGMAAGQELSAGALALMIPSDAPIGEGSLLLQTALQDAAVLGDEHGLSADIQGATSVAGKRKVSARLGGGAAQAADAMSAPGTQGLGVLGAKGQAIPSGQLAVPQPLATERRDVGAGREGSRPLEFGVDGVPSALAPFVAETTQGGRVLTRGVESSAPSLGAGGAASDPSHETSIGLRSESGTGGVDPAMAGAEDAVAEQVAYWVHQNIQNARMTVRHDGQPVEVSVSLTGNEAHVAFGSDEAQTREMLDGSVAQLRDMLQQKGLLLSGVTVGESGRRHGDEEGGSGNSKNARKQAQVVLPAAEAQAAGRARVQGDRTVDIFV